ncbi:MAG: hypothetical protein O2979_06570 [Proteobacteria bacterium]|nr:hypothetical protein [Pseudomonadota bacterium]
MKLEAVARLLREAARATKHRHFVIVGSLAAIGASTDPPARMVQSIYVDLFPKLDPQRLEEINARVGEGSDFHVKHGYYADALPPEALSLPAQWEARLIQMPLEGGVTAWFLDPNDAAASKLIRGAQNDLEWVDAGLQAGLLSAAHIGARLRSIDNALAGEVPAALDTLAALARRQ